LNAAAAVLIQRGYGGLRYRDVAEAAGVPVASLQHYFPNLADLRREALLHTVNDEIRTLAEYVEQIPEPWARLTYLIEMSMDCGPDQSQPQWVLWLEFWRAAAHDPTIAAENVKNARAMHQLIDAAIQDGIYAGVLRPRAPVSEIVRTILAMIDGLGVHLAINDGGAWDPSSAVQLIMNYARLVLQVGVDDAVFDAELAYSRQR
jgi:AcrR family transcriptional regulator